MIPELLLKKERKALGSGRNRGLVYTFN